MRGNERAVSVAVNHVLALAITTILITGLIAGAGGMLQDQRESATRSELETIGNRMATEMEGAETAALEGNATVTLRTDHPTRVAGQNYQVELRTDGTCAMEACLVLTATETDQQVVVDYRNRTRVEPATVSGGRVVVVTDGDRLTIEEAP